jgi:hypothetical protein
LDLEMRVRHLLTAPKKGDTAMRREHLKLLTGADEAAPVDLAEILLARKEHPSTVLRVMPSDRDEYDDPDDAA